MQAEIPAAPTQTQAKARIAWPHIVLGIIGILASIYAVWAHYRIAANLSAGCSISEEISCDAVIGSKWGTFFNIPLGYFGLVFWAIVIVTAISSATSNRKMDVLQRLGVATVGIATSAYYFYIAEFVIHKTCPICLTTHTTSLVNFLFALVAWLNLRKSSTT